MPVQTEKEEVYIHPIRNLCIRRSGHDAAAALPPEKTRYLLYRRLGGLRGRSGLAQKISRSPGFDHRSVQPVTSCYTDFGIPAAYCCVGGPEILQFS
jgi:hypothetical protein